jgi:hypothetical protein
MKTKLVILTAMMIIAISPSADAGPHAGGFGGGNFVSGGRAGGFAGGGSRPAPAFSGGAVRAAPAFRGGYFTGRSVGGLSRAPHVYYGRPAMPGVTSERFRASGIRPTTRIAGRTSPISSRQYRSALLTRQNARVTNSQVAATNRAGSIGGRNRVSNPRMLTAANRQSFVKNHASERHDGNWHSDWDRHRAHFDHNRVFVFIDGFWWGLYPWDFYGAYPYDYSAYPYDYSNPYDYSYEYPYDSSYDYPSEYPYDYYDPSSYDYSGYNTNPTVREVQSELAKLGYYHGPIDGIQGDVTEAALARYQQDNELSVTGTVTSATLQTMGL